MEKVALGVGSMQAVFGRMTRGVFVGNWKRTSDLRKIGCGESWLLAKATWQQITGRRCGLFSYETSDRTWGVVLKLYQRGLD